MNIRITNSDEPTVLHIESEITIYTVALLQQQLQQYLPPQHDLPQLKELELNLADVNEIDGAGLQLLIALKQQAVANNTLLRLSCHSPAVLEAFDLCNMAAFFGDPLILSDVNHG